MRNVVIRFVGVFVFGFVCVVNAKKGEVYFFDTDEIVSKWCSTSTFVHNVDRKFSIEDYCGLVYTEINKIRIRENKTGFSFIIYHGLDDKLSKSAIKMEMPFVVTQTVFSAFQQLATALDTTVVYSNGVFFIGEKQPRLMEPENVLPVDPFLVHTPECL